MGKILLIRPAQIRWINEEKRLAQPLGILSIASYLRKKGHEVWFIDVAAEGYDTEIKTKSKVYRFGLLENELKRRIEILNPQVVGITSNHSVFWREVEKTANLVKSVNRRIITILGGNHATGAFKEILEKDRQGAFDYIALGEGERQIPRLVECLTKRKQDIRNIKGIAYKEGTKIEYSFKQPVEDLDELPDPAFDLLKTEFYTDRMSHFGKLRAKNFFTFSTQRGCSRGCYFCTSRYFFGKKVRFNSLSRVKAQLEKIYEMGFQQIIFQDDNALLLPADYRLEYYRIPKELGIPAFHDSGYYYPSMTKEHIKELTKCGIHGIYLPVESPSLSTMHAQRKYLEVRSEKEQRDKLEEVTKALHKNDIEFYCGIMIGFPKESIDDLRSAVEFGRFLKKLGAFAVVFNWVHPYPGTPLYQRSYKLVPTERKWYEHPEFWNFIKPVFPVEGISLEDAEKYINENFLMINGTNSRNIGYHH